MPALVRALRAKRVIVFHCALSQQRGPAAARGYVRERARVWPADNASPEAAAPAPAQQVYILDRGFVGWQKTYGNDSRLTVNYDSELWKEGY